MGANKALLPIDGKPALAVVLATIRESGMQSPVVVLGHDDEAVRRAVDLSNCVVIVNTQPERGLSRSMKLGLDAIDTSVDGALVFHVDMPYLASSTIRAVLQAAESGAVFAAPSHGEQRGFPVYFGQAVIPALMESLRGDSGGRAFLARHVSDLRHVPVVDPGCIVDLDHPSDIEAWKGASLCAINE
jgi:CTP:molybdopterin cytidylyltransferase MocA